MMPTTFDSAGRTTQDHVNAWREAAAKALEARDSQGPSDDRASHVFASGQRDETGAHDASSEH